jgi:iron complex outermembrane receptor protein
MKFLLTLVSIAISHVLFSQTDICTISGCLLDKNTGAVISDATIQNVNFGDSIQVVRSDQNGYFSMQASSFGNWIQLNLEGYNDTIDLPKNHCGTFQFYYAQPIANKLQSIIVQGFQNTTFIQKIPSSIGYVDRKTLSSTDQTSLQNAVNTIPGVIMESRGYGGSHRLSIRGSALRSPFAVRNVKMYLEGIPFTSPDGQTPLELIDPFDISSLEIIKGPAGSVWGSGNGGALLFKAKKALIGKSEMGFSSQIGSYDSKRTTRFIEVGLKNGGLRISQVDQQNAGYRQLEYNNKRQISISLNQYFNEKNKIFAYGTYYTGNWGLPGGLTQKQTSENPTQAIAFSLDNQAELERNRLMSGLAHTHKFGEHLSETTSIYFYSTQKTNPYGTSNFNSGYKDEGADGFGGRTDWKYQNKISPRISYSLNLGGEWQAEKYSILENKIVNGEPGDFKYIYDIGYVSTMAFLSSDFYYKDRFTLNAGASINQTKQDVRGFTSNGFEFDTLATWSSEILPRFALNARIIDQLYVFSSLSYGNSNPTAFEMVDYENNQFNLKLKPEHGVNMELGLKQSLEHLNIQYELSFYEFILSDAILGYVDTTGIEDDRTKYRNSGRTVQHGLEWLIAKKIAISESGSFLQITHSGCSYRYRFSDYVLNDENFTDNYLPGVPLYNVSNQLLLSILNGCEIGVMHYWFDKTPLNNANSDWSKAYHLLNARIGYHRTFLNKLAAGIYAGINNVMDTEYTSFLGLNAAGSRYFNPAPPSNYFGGITISWKL